MCHIDDDNAAAVVVIADVVVADEEECDIHRDVVAYTLLPQLQVIQLMGCHVRLTVRIYIGHMETLSMMMLLFAVF